MKTQQILHSPTLESVSMVEKTIRKYSGEFGKYQLWRKLPKQMRYQTFQVILDHLLDSGKIAMDKKGKMGWIWDPEGVKRFLSRKDLH